MKTHLVRLRPRADTLYTSQNRSVVATGRDGFIDAGPDQGFFVHGTRLLSRYFLNGRPPRPNGLSNVDQHTWLGYYVAASPPYARGEQGTLGPGGVIAQQPIELRISRYVDDGFHEDVDVTNFSQETARLTLELRVDGDFADVAETKGPRRQHGHVERRWQQVGADAVWELSLEYHAEHAYDHHGEKGVAAIDRGVRLRLERASTPPLFREGSSSSNSS